MKKREKEKGRNVVAVILDRYEEHSSDWKKYGDEGAAGRRTVFVEQELYDWEAGTDSTDSGAQ